MIGFQNLGPFENTASSKLTYGVSAWDKVQQGAILTFLGSYYLLHPPNPHCKKTLGRVVLTRIKHGSQIMS